MTPEPVAENIRKILVVDDNRELCENLKDIIDSIGHKVTCAFDGHEAIETVLKDPPDIVIMDIQMPGVDGLTALQQIKQLAPAARIFLMTGHPNQQIIDRAEREGARAILHKPLDVQRLLQLIHNDENPI